MKHSRLKRVLALVLVAALICGMNLSSAYAVEAASTPVTFQELDPSQVSAELVNTQGDTVQLDSAEPYEATELVRAMIVLEQDSTLTVMQASGEALTSQAAVQYRQKLDRAQEQMASRISRQCLAGEPLDVVWNLTLSANAISANVAYGKLEEIRQVPGVKAVYLETRYEPMTQADTSNVVAQQMTGAASVQQDAGYTGAGARIAVVDTGTDTDHQSFSNAAWEYSLKLQAEKKGMSLEDYMASLDLMDAEEIAGVLSQLHVAKRDGNLTGEDLYLNGKLPFVFNYIDGDLDVTHDNDEQGEHGSHVAGITSAGDYIPTKDASIYDFDGDGDLDQADAQALMDHVVKGSEIHSAEYADLSGNGSVSAYDVHLLLDQLEGYEEDGTLYVSAAQAVGVTGVAPDAQLITMKVFGKKGGAYSSDYMAAVEDAVVLGCDTVNLSLGAPYPGFVTAHEDAEEGSAFVDRIMEELSETGIIMCVAAGNDGNWADQDEAFGLMYTDEAGTHRVSSPSTYENALSVASVDNVGFVSEYESLFISASGDAFEPAVEKTPNGVQREWKSLDEAGEGTTYEVVFLGDPSNLFAGKTQTDERIYAASAQDFAGFDFTGKVVLTARGNQVLFADKHQNAQAAGAAAALIYNNVSGALNASIEGSTATIPCGGLSMEDAQAIFALCQKNEAGLYTCTLKVTNDLHVNNGEDVKYPTMSDFSSWGTTDDLTIKPEITAPGGNIYSVNGLLKETDGYEVMSGTSMATPHVAGLVALAEQYVREAGLLSKAQAVTGNEKLSQRNLIQSLLMSTAMPLIEESTGLEYSVRNQGAGLANVQNLVKAQSMILVDGQPDGKVKAELGDGETGWSFSFRLYNLSAADRTYTLDASMLTTDTVTAEAEGKTYNLSADQMAALGAELTYTGEAVADGRVTVPAGGSAQVKVEIQIPAKAVEHMKALGYANGFYVEGFVYVRPEADAEGALDVTHSIPVLGWYGNWTDPSMFDTGSYLEYAYGTLQRPSHINTNVKNAMTWCPKGYGAGLYYTGNIYGSYSESTGLVGDQHYYPERNALSTRPESQWQFYALFPTLIRNATDVEVRITDADTGKLYYVNDYETFDDYMMASFYYTNAGQWYDTTSDYGVGFDWDYVDPETGETIPEGTRIRFSLLCAPDYYINDDGSVRWDDLGKGASLSYEFTVDNTAPKLVGSQPLTLSADGKTLYYTAQDENYIAAVVLMNGSASKAVSYSYPDMPLSQKGKAVSGSLDLASYAETNGNKAVIAVCDYAGNETYYVINLNGSGNSYGSLVAFQNSADGVGGAWTSFGEGVAKNETSLFASAQNMVCAEYVNGVVFAQTDNGNLYGIPYDDFLAESIDLESTYIAHLDCVYQDLAYSYGQGKLFGLAAYGSGADSEFVVNSINLKGSYFDEELWEQVDAYQEDWVAGRSGVFGLTLACDDAGSLYVMGTSVDEETGEESTAQLWKAALQTDWSGTVFGPFRMVGETGLSMNYLQSMTWDHNTETLYWAQFYPMGMSNLQMTLQKVDPATGACTQVGTLSAETCAMFAPLSEEAAAKEAHANVPVIDRDEVGAPVLRDDTVVMSVGSARTLLYDLDPWYTTHKDVIWSSDNEEVATVDQNGTVTAVGEGSCTITAAAKDDLTKVDTCAVHVSALDLSLEGIISAQSAGIGSVTGAATYKYDMVKSEPTFGTEKKITWPEEFQGFGQSLATSTMGRGSMWACEYDNTGMIYEIDPETGVVKDMLEPIDGDMMFGMTYSETTDLFTSIMNFYLYVDQPFTHEAEQEIIDSYDQEEHMFMWHRLDMSSYLKASDQNFQTGETGNGSIVDVVFCGITTLEGEGEQYLSQDYLGKYAPEISYKPTTTLVLLDNVGRLWYIDEMTDMKKVTGETGSTYFTDATGAMMIPESFNGVLSLGYDTDGDGTDDSYSVFVIRQIQETPLLDMYLDGTMPRITYHFSDVAFAGRLEDGTPMFVMSLYDYWNNGITNELYLYVPGHETDELDHETWQPIRTPDRLFDLGDTGEHNIVATIHKATVTGGVSVQTEADAEVVNTFCGFYQG